MTIGGRGGGFPARGPKARLKPSATAPLLSGPVPPMATNANAPQLALSVLMAGAGVIFAPPLPQGVVGPAEYQYGTHAAHIYNAEALKSDVFPSVPAPPAVTVPNPLRTIIAGPQQADLTVSGWAIGSAQAPSGPVPSFQYASQDNPSQIGGQVFKAVFQMQVATGPVPAFVGTQPQLEDRPTRQVFASQVVGTSRAVAALLYAAPQGFDLTVQGQVFKAATPAVVSYVAQVFGSPQQFDLTQQAWVIPSAAGGAQGAVPPFVVGQQQADVTQIAALVQASAPTPPAIFGATVAPAPPTPPQFDANTNQTQVWTPATFSPGLPPSATFAVTPGKLPPWPWSWTHSPQKPDSAEYIAQIQRAMLLEQHHRAEKRRLEREFKEKKLAARPGTARQNVSQNRDYAILRRKIRANDELLSKAVTKEIELRLRVAEYEAAQQATVAARRKRELMMVLLLA